MIIQEKLVKDVSAPVMVIPCCVDLALFSAENPLLTNKLQIRKMLKISPDQFTLGYVGSIGTWYMLKEMLAFFYELLKTKPEAVFLFVTKEEPNKIYEASRELGIRKESIRVTSVSRKEMPSYILAFDWSIFFIKPVFSKQASSPTKQGELMGMKIPTIYNSGIGDTDLIMEKYKAGIPVTKFDSSEYKQKIDLIDSFQLNVDMIRAGSLEVFSLDRGISSYLEIYQKLLD